MEYYEYNTDSVLLGQQCGGPVNISQKTSHSHVGYNLLTLDMNGDGDKDLIMGDLQWNNLLVIYNGKTKYKWNEDTAVSWDSTFPSNTLPAKIPQFPAPFYVDIDNDGNRDLIVTPQQTSDGSYNLDDIWYYHNSGTDAKPVFQFVQKDFLLNTTIEFGKKSSPAFFDYNGDGLPDMVVATLGDFAATGHAYERLVLYQNIGTKARAVFKKVDDDYMHISAMKLTGLRPAFGDLNGDSAVDMVLGSFDNIYFFKNISAPHQKDSFVLESSKYEHLDTLGYFLAPYIVDLNKDGLADLVIGEQDGNFNYIENTGTATHPAFTYKTNFLGRVRSTTYSWQPTNWDPITGAPTDSVYTFDAPGTSTPVVADINGDGKLDLVSGSYYGDIYIWLDIEDHLADSCPGRVDTFVYNIKTQQLEKKWLGVTTAPAVAFLDGDSLPDIVVGNERGGLNYFGTQQTMLGIAQIPPVDKRFKIYPNPTDKYLTIEAGPNNNVSDINITLYDLSGKQVYEKRLKNFNSSASIDVSKLSAGVYYLSIRSNRAGIKPWTAKVEVK